MRKNKTPKGAPTWPEDELVPKKIKETKEAIMNNLSTEIMKTVNADLNKSIDTRRDLVPEEEQEVGRNWDDVKVVSFDDDLETLLPSDEVCLEVDETDKLDEETGLVGLGNDVRCNSIALLRGMGNIRGVFDDQLYARIIVGDKGKSVYEYCQVIDGYASIKLKIEQAFVLRLAKAGFKFENLESYERKYVMKTLMDVENEFLNTWDGRGYPVGVLDVVYVLHHLRRLLPVSYLGPVDRARALYERIKTVLSDGFYNCYCEKKAYYAYFPEYLPELARALSMTERDLLRQLKKFNLLYLQPLSVGHQAKVRTINNIPCWAICIYKLEYFDSLEKNANKQKVEGKQKTEDKSELESEKGSEDKSDQIRQSDEPKSLDADGAQRYNPPHSKGVLV